MIKSEQTARLTQAIRKWTHLLHAYTPVVVAGAALPLRSAPKIPFVESHYPGTGLTRLRTQVAFLSLSCVLPVTACTHSPQTLRQETPTVVPDVVTTFVYACIPSIRFVVRVDNNHAWLFLPRRTLNLPRVHSASGTRYALGDVIFWSKGDEAVLALGDRHYRDCRNDRSAAVWEHAKLSGADFRAIGNEPPWVLEIRDRNQIILRTGYEKRLYHFAETDVASDRNTGITSYDARSGDDVLKLHLRREKCPDSMSGEVFETRVKMQLNGKILAGCGRPLH